jgi:hypothetical protein
LSLHNVKDHTEKQLAEIVDKAIKCFARNTDTLLSAIENPLLAEASEMAAYGKV